MSNTKDDLTMIDVMNLQAVRRKLKLSMFKLTSAEKARKKNPDLSDDDITCQLLGLKPGTDYNAYLKTKLSDGEMETLGKFLKI
jgi:hypothetical protein